MVLGGGDNGDKGHREVGAGLSGEGEVDEGSD